MSAQNFKNQDLTGQNFDGQDLSYSLFRGANLTNCSFVGCDLTGINMRETTIEGADFTNAEMFCCNQRDAVGTANWTNAKTYGVPKWVDMVGSDRTTTPRLRRVEKVLQEVFTQAGTDLASITNDSDKNILSNWWQGGQPIDTLVGIYGDVPHGRNLYISTFEADDQDIRDISLVLNGIMTKNVAFDMSTNSFQALT